MIGAHKRQLSASVLRQEIKDPKFKIDIENEKEIQNCPKSTTMQNIGVLAPL